MTKLVLKYSWGDEGCSGTSIIPFEYASKEKFLFDVWTKYDDAFWANTHERGNVELLGVVLYKHDIDDLDYLVLTLDEWFECDKFDGNMI